MSRKAFLSIGLAIFIAGLIAGGVVLLIGRLGIDVRVNADARQVIGLRSSLLIVLIGLLVIVAGRLPITYQAAEWWPRIRHGYTNLSMMVLNTLLLLVISSLLLDWITPTEISAWTVIDSKGFRPSFSMNHNHYYYSSPTEVEGVLQELDMFMANGEWQVEPGIGLTNQAFSGDYMNVNEQGIRVTTASLPTDPDLPPLVIWIFGGSTTFGWGLPDQHTIPSFLQNHLQEQLADQRLVQVVNFGVPYYDSSHEFFDFTTQLRENETSPDIVIFMDGLNDVFFGPGYPDQPSPLYAALDAAWDQQQKLTFLSFPWLQLSTNYPVIRAARLSGIQIGPSTGSFHEQAGPKLSEEEQHALITARYLSNHQMASAISAEFDIQPYFILQPVPIWQADDRQTITFPPYQAFVSDIITHSDGTIYDMTGVLADMDTYYAVDIDGIHYSDAASDFLAERMAQLILDNYPAE